MTLGYSLPFSLSILLAFAWLGFVQPESRLRSGRYLLETEARINVGLVALVCGLVGARLGFILVHWSYYSQSFIEIVWLWQGGLSWVGGVVGVLLGIGIIAKATKTSFFHLTDLLAIPAVLISIGSWFGCVLDPCAYGRITNPSWFTPQTLDLMGNVNPRWPTATIGTIYSLLLLLGTHRLYRRPFPAGTLSSITISLIALGAIGLSFIRGDPSRMIGAIRIDGLASGGVLLLGLIGLINRIRNHQTKEKA